MLMRSSRSTASMCCMSVPRIVDRDGHSLLIHARADACRLRSSGEGSRQGNGSRRCAPGFRVPELAVAAWSCHIYFVSSAPNPAPRFLLLASGGPVSFFYELACEKDIVGNGA